MLDDTSPYRLLTSSVAALALSATGCQLLVDLDKEQCQTADDCTAFGANFTCEANVCRGPETPELPPQWACLDDLPTVEDLPMAQPNITLTMSSVDYGQMLFSDGAQVEMPAAIEGRVCASVVDEACMQPLATGVRVEEPFPALAFDFSPPNAGFSGYVFLEVPDDVDPLLGPYFPTMVMSNRPYVEDWSGSIPPINRVGVIRQIVDAAGETIDETLGTIILQLHDCEGGPGENVRVTFGEDTDTPIVPFYFDGIIPEQGSFTETHLTSNATLDGRTRAYAGFYNVPPGNHAIQVDLIQFSEREDSREVIARRKVADVVVTVRGGRQTMALIYPGDF